MTDKQIEEVVKENNKYFEENKTQEDYCCYSCKERDMCEWSFDPYNAFGECIISK